MSTAVSAQGLDPARSVGLDTLYALDGAKRRSLMLSPATQPQWRDAAHAALAADGVPVTVIQDSPGFVAQRIVPPSSTSPATSRSSRSPRRRTSTAP